MCCSCSWTRWVSIGHSGTLSMLTDAAAVRAAHERWLAESLRQLESAGRIVRDGDGYRAADGAPSEPETVWERWEREKQAGGTQAAAEAGLAEATLRSLPGILTGRVLATDVMFPDSSLRLVRPVYRGNPVSDHFNDVLARAAVAHIDARVAVDPAARVRIIEIGAGTGATTAAVLERLRRLSRQHRGVPLHGPVAHLPCPREEDFASEHPYLRRVDLRRRGPGRDARDPVGTYDLAIAANVLHATRDIRRTLRHRQGDVASAAECCCSTRSRTTTGFTPRHVRPARGVVALRRRRPAHPRVPRAVSRDVATASYRTRGSHRSRSPRASVTGSGSRSSHA